MAAIMPNTPSTGNNIPVSSYIAGITESYPNVNRQRVVESSINSKETIDFMPVNMGLNQTLTDKYLEFRINGIVGSFLDMSSIVLELNIKPVKSSNLGTLDAETHIYLTNGLSNTLFKSATVFINEKMIEANPFFNYSSYIKLLKSMSEPDISRYGQSGYIHDDYNYHPDGITRIYTADTFTQDTNIESKLRARVKADGVYIYFPLMLDVSTLDMYLLDGIDIRVRLELANNDWIINTNLGTDSIRLNVTKAKLWIDRVTPQYNAMNALNHALITKPLEYVFKKTLYKSFVIGTGESTIMIDQPFTNCIPDKLTMVIVDMNTMSGHRNHNPLYFNHCNIGNIHITINGTSIYNINSDFTSGDYSHLFYECQKSLGIDTGNMITYDSFDKGRSIFCFNFINEPVEDSLPIERSANLRMTLTFKQAMQTPHVIILLADTTGLITIDKQRIVSCDVRG